ncbi:MAG: hypothetical protein MESAZ_02470 [Saezia sanguinis]
MAAGRKEQSKFLNIKTEQSHYAQNSHPQGQDENRSSQYQTVCVKGQPACSWFWRWKGAAHFQALLLLVMALISLLCPC